MSLLTVEALRNGGEVDWGVSLNALIKSLVNLVKTEQLNEVSTFRNLADFGFLGVIEDLYFESAYGTVYHLLPYNPAQIGFFVRTAGVPDNTVPEVKRITSKARNRQFLRWLGHALESNLIGEITLIETFDTPQFRHLDRVFQTRNREFIELIAPDGPMPCRYGLLGQVSPLQPPSNLWTIRKQ